MKRYREELSRAPSRSCYDSSGLVNLFRRSETIRRSRLHTRTPEKVMGINSSGEWVRYKDVEELLKNAQEVARLLELGDRRLLASDGACGGQNAAVALSPEESAKLYQACKKIAAGVVER